MLHVMNLRKKCEKWPQDLERTKYRFILIEIDLALTFSEISLTSDDKAKAARNAGKCAERLRCSHPFSRGRQFLEQHESQYPAENDKSQHTTQGLSARTSRLAPAKLP